MSARGLHTRRYNEFNQGEEEAKSLQSHNSRRLSVRKLNLSNVISSHIKNYKRGKYEATSQAI